MTRHDGRNGTLTRVLMLMRYIAGRQRVDLHAAAAHFNCHRRTIRRDLMALEEAGWPVPPWRMADVEVPNRASPSSPNRPSAAPTRRCSSPCAGRC